MRLIYKYRKFGTSHFRSLKKYTYIAFHHYSTKSSSCLFDKFYISLVKETYTDEHISNGTKQPYSCHICVQCGRPYTSTPLIPSSFNVVICVVLVKCFSQ